MSDLKMGTGPNPALIVGIVAGVLVLGGGGYYFFGGSDSKSEEPLEVAAAEPVMDDSAVFEPAGTPEAMTDDSAMTEAAPAADSGMETAAAAPEASPPETPVVADPDAAMAAVAPSGMEIAMATPPSSSYNTAETSTESEVAAVSPEDNVPRDAVAPARPPANEALHAWWQTDRKLPYSVKFVGQASDSQSLVILFSEPIDAGALGGTIKIVGPDGKPVGGSWQAGGSQFVAVNNGLQPGRYTVLIDPQTKNAQGEALGTSLYGPIYIQ